METDVVTGLTGTKSANYQGRILWVTRYDIGTLGAFSPTLPESPVTKHYL